MRFFFSSAPSRSLVFALLSLFLFFSLAHLGRDRVEEVSDALLAARLGHSGSRERLHERVAHLAVADGLPERDFVLSDGEGKSVERQKRASLALE